MSGGIDPRRLSLHAGTLRPARRFEQKAALAARAGFGAWALRGVELEAYLAEGRTIDDKGYTGYFVVEVLSQTLWRGDPLALAQRCHAGAMKVLAAA